MQPVKMIKVLNFVLVLLSGALAGNEWRMQVHSGALWRIEQLVLSLEEAIKKDVKEISSSLLYVKEMQKSMEDFKRHNVTTSNEEHQEIKVTKTELYGFHA